MKHIKKMILALVILCASNYAFSENLEEKLSQSWRWTEFDEHYGLPTNEVLNIIETDDHTIWIVTFKGFAWYDGFQWVTISDSTNKYFKSPFNLYTNYNVLPGFKDECLTSFDNNIVRITKAGIEKTPIIINNKKIIINDMVRMEKNKLLILGYHEISTNKKLYLVDDGKITSFPLPDEFSKKESNKNDISIFNGTDRSIWLACSLGLYRLIDGRWKKQISINHNSHLDMSRPVVNKNGTGFFYISFPAEYTGLWQYSNENKPFLSDSLKITLAASNVNIDGDILTSYFGGNVEYYHNTWNKINFPHEALKNSYRMLFSSSGDLWVTTSSKLFLCKLSSNRWTYWKSTESQKRNFVNEILKLKDGSFWIAYGDGVEHRSDTGIIDFYQKIDHTSLEGVTAINNDNDGNIWIGSGGFFNSVFKWNGSDWKHIDLLSNNEKLLVHKIRKDSKGRLWFLTLSGETREGGYGAFELINGEFKRWDDTKGLISNRIYDFVEDKEGAYWFATYAGLSRFSNGKWKHWNSTNGLKADLIYSLALHPDGKTIFYSNYGTGVGYIKNDSAFKVADLDSLNIKKIMSMTFDYSGRLWIGTKNGLICYFNNNVIRYTQDNGLNSNFIWPVLADSNKLYIGTTGSGINILDLSNMNVKMPEIKILDYKDLNNNATITWQILPYYGTFTDQEYLVQFRIDDQPWSEWSDANSISLKNIYPGEHIFSIRSMDLLGRIDKKVYSLNFKIDIPIYRRLEFIIPVIILLTFSLLIIIYFFIKRSNYLSELKKSRSELRKSERKYRHIIEKANDGILINENGIIKFFNNKLLTMTGYSADELLDKPIIDFVHPSDHYNFKKIQDDFQSGHGAPDRFETKIIKKDGSLLWADIRATILEIEDGYSTLGIITDIANRKEYEAKLQDALKKEQELGQLKTSIISTVSHEYRTPLTIMQTAADLLKIYYQLRNDNKFHENIVKINSSIERMTDFLEDIMLLSKIESKNIQLNYETVNLPQFCNDVVNNTKAQLKKNFNIDLEYNNIDKLKIETNLFQVILTRIISNAIKYSPEESIIEVNLSQSAGYLTIIVKDNGYGIPEDKMQNLYDPFFKNKNNIDDKSSGKGFGLTIVKGCLDLLNGIIEVKSKMYQGTTVIIRIPLID